MELLCNIVSKLGRRSSNNIFVTLSDRSLISKEHFHTFIVTRHQFTFSSNIVLTPQSSIINTYTIGFKRNTFDIHRNNDFDFMNSSDLDLGSNQYIKFHIKIYPVVFFSNPVNTQSDRRTEKQSRVKTLIAFPAIKKNLFATLVFGSHWPVSMPHQ